MTPTRAEAEQLDALDPLAGFRDRFFFAEDGPIYLDGNSLGRMPLDALPATDKAMRDGWGTQLVGVWDDWLDIGQRIGDHLGQALLGAEPGETAISDSTTVNLYKLASAALDARRGRRAIVASAEDFPTDRHVLEGLAAARDLEMRWLRPTVDGVGATAVHEALGPDVALVLLSHVSYRSGAIEDMAAITAAAHEAGALMLWDLCHAVGAVPVDLRGAGVDLAAGCTYKYVNAGPGAPAFLYVRRELQAELRQPIWGWFGQRDQFTMGAAYDPEPTIARYLAGTPPVLSILPIETGVRLLAEAGLGRLREKGMALTELLVGLADDWLAPLGFEVASPREPARRGSHVALAHPEACAICQALIEAGVIPDFRAPNLIRLAPAPIYTRFVDVWDGMDRLRRTAAR